MRPRPTRPRHLVPAQADHPNKPDAHIKAEVTGNETLVKAAGLAPTQ